MTETQERFLRSVLTRVPLDDIVEMHLFPPIRRGTMETGVAVIATLLPPVPLTVVDAGAPAADEVNADEVDAVPADIVVEQSTEDAVMSEDVSEDATADATDDETIVAEADSVDADDTADADDDSPYADEPVAVADDVVADDAQTDAAEMQLVSDDASEVEASDAPAAPEPRLRILTAAYRHTIKGIDRGKWVVDVQEEADAPLSAVEAVLRGVRHRSTEPADPELVSAESLAALLEPTRVAPAA